ncbi:LysR family transcriptional regulator [Actibacterium atlanticum]|uniref:LysR family transcriptional regulator n=1 Tax=Actibacterium atlanticum TaxID=1461693 RepID=A0A058ZL89_9RHOB|nr:LysR family transcriptional regulator [Actibacterium atlanticum]KCV81967.1 LysR family transcriptional regulator [Actibacterium atlanticum]
MNLHWDDLKTVLELVRHGSLASAGAQLGVNYTTVARRVARAEAALGEVLFERLADGYQPTEAALLVARHAGEMQQSEDTLLRHLAGRDERLSGPLTLTAPQLLIAHVLAPALQTFAEAHPNVDLRVKATNDLLDLTRREADLGVRVSRDPGDTLTGLRLAAQDSASFASADWAARIAEDPTAPIDWIVYEAHATLPKHVLQTSPSSRIRYRFDDMIALAGAAQAGLGVVRMPMFLGRSLDGLVQVPLLPPTPYMDIWLVGHPDVWPSAKVTALRQAIRADLKARRALFVA